VAAADIEGDTWVGAVGLLDVVDGCRLYCGECVK